MMTNERVFFNTTDHVCKQTYYSIFACEKSISGCYNYNYLPKFTSFINCWITLSLSVLSFLGWFCSYYNSRVNAIIPSFSQLESGHFHPTHLGWLEAAQSLTHQYFSRLESHMATSALLHSFPIQFEDTVDCFQSLRSIQSLSLIHILKESPSGWLMIWATAHRTDLRLMRLSWGSVNILQDEYKRQALDMEIVEVCCSQEDKMQWWKCGIFNLEKW